MCGSSFSSAVCTVQDAICATGQAGSSADATYNYFCLPDLPNGALPTGSGALCYTQLGACNNGPNACNSTYQCVVDLNTCGTGIASSNAQLKTNGAAIYFCTLDTPPGAFPIGSGQYW